MAAVYLVGLLFVLGVVQGGPTYNSEAIIEDIRDASKQPRIVVGTPAVDGQIPFQISLRMVSLAGAVSSCGGSVIHHQWVLTAAHCLANRITFVVRFGLVDLSRPDVIVETTRKYIHPDYNEITAGVQTDDIALLGIDQHIPYSDTIQPCRLMSRAQKNVDYSNKRMVVSGYGRTDDTWLGGAASSILLWTFQRGMSNDECLRVWYPNSRVIREQTICAGWYNVTYQASCQGDSGGPLTIVDADGERTMLGVVSFGSSRGCNNAWPTGYVRPGHYHDWFTEVTDINFDWDSNEAASSEEDSEENEDPDSVVDSDEDEDSEGDEDSEEGDDSEGDENSDESPEKVIVVN